ncbi:hypothetical protein PQX77_003326 [Marasmius sp. AFHP31]|nr:hypothetical protein PQX77_003326 [Marasmius sp. AFHP31]
MSSLRRDTESTILEPQFPAAYKPETPHIHNLPQTGDCWKECLKKVDESDADRCKGWREDIDTLLVFAGLFSAVVTAFTVESYQWLDTDPEDATAEVLIHIVNHLNLGLNASLPTTLPSEFGPPASSIRINICWFLSLTISLTAVIIGILCKQWIREHRRSPAKHASHRDTLLLRQMRYQSLQQWGVSGMAHTLPLLLESALVLFFLGVLDLLWSLNTTVAIVVTIEVGLAVLFILATTVLPTLSFTAWKPSVPCAYKSPQAWLFYQFTDIILPSNWPGLGVGVNPFFRGLSDWFGVDISHSSYFTRDVDDSLVESAMDWMNESFGASQEMSLNIYRCLEDYSTHRSSYLPRGLRSPSDLHKYNLLTRYHGWYWWDDSTRRHLLELLLRAVNDSSSSDEDITNALDRIGRVAMEFSGGKAALSLDADPELFKNLGEDLLLRVFSSLKKFCLQDRASPTHFLACYSILNRYWLRMKQEWPNRWPDWDQPVSFISDLDEWLSSAPEDNRYRIPRILKCVWLLNSIVLEPPIAFERSAVLRFAQMLDERISRWGIVRMLMEQLGESGGLRTMSWSDAYRNLKRMSYRGKEVDLDLRGEDGDGDGKDVIELDPARLSSAASVVT